MTKQVIFVFLFVVLFAFEGGDSGTQSIQYQDIAEIAWQPDGNGIYGFLQSYVLTVNSSQPSIAYDFAKFDAAGTLVKTYTNTPKSRTNDLSSGDQSSYAP